MLFWVESEVKPNLAWRHMLNDQIYYSAACDKITHNDTDAHHLPVVVENQLRMDGIYCKPKKLKKYKLWKEKHYELVDTRICV